MKTLEQRKKESYKIFDDIAPTYDLLNRLLSMGIDVLWRKKMMTFLPPKKNLTVLDLATGTGDVAIELSKQQNVSKVIGMDLSSEMISIGNNKLKKLGHAHKANLQIGNGVEVPVEGESVDAVTLSFGIRNFNDPKLSIKNIYKALKPGGRILIMEFSIPENFIFRNIYFFYFRHLLPFIGNIISGHKDAYTYLNKTVEDFPYGEEFLALIKDAGFKKTRICKLTFGIASIYIGEK